jgi:hypothetical protein
MSQFDWGWRCLWAPIQTVGYAGVLAAYLADACGAQLTLVALALTVVGQYWQGGQPQMGHPSERQYQASYILPYSLYERQSTPGVMTHSQYLATPPLSGSALAPDTTPPLARSANPGVNCSANTGRGVQ